MSWTIKGNGTGQDLLYSQAGTPALDLRLATTKSLTDYVSGQNLVTFTRASTGTFVGSDGVLRTAVTNLRTFSDAILAVNLYGANVSTLATVTTATPTASTTASLFALNAGANTGNATDGFNYGSSVTLSNSTQHTQSLFVKPAGATVLRLRSNVGGSLFDFTLTGNGTAPSISSDLQGASIVSLANGWYRVSWTFTTTTSAPGNRGDYWSIKTNVADGTNGLYVVGAQLEQSTTVGEYIPTTSTINSAPRFDHNPTTGESLGLLVEEARTNLLARSEEFDSASWGKQNTTVFADLTAGPTGSTTADKLVATATTGAHTTQQSFTFIQNTAYTYSCFLKAGELLGASLNIAGGSAHVAVNLSTGAINGSGGSADVSGINAAITPFGSGWYRCSVSFTWVGASLATTCRIALSSTATHTAAQPSFTGDGTSGIYIWGAQLEVGAFPTSYIPTTTAAATRSADVASITGANFSSWYNNDQGTIFTLAKQPSGYGSPVIGLGSGTGSIYQASVNGAEWWNGSNALGPATAGSGNWVTGAKIVGAYTSSNRYLCFNGGSVVSSASSLPNSGSMQIGRTAALQGSNNGPISRLTYWPTRLPNATLQQITQ